MQESIVFLVRVQCRCKESSRSLSHLLMTFLFVFKYKIQNTFQVKLKYKILAKYLKYVFKILVFQILYNSGCITSNRICSTSTIRISKMMTNTHNCI